MISNLFFKNIQKDTTHFDILTLQKNLEKILYITAALCFIGHGAWGVITKEAWVPFFTSMGISENWAWTLMPVIGSVDIFLGLALLFRPTRVVLLWMAGWCVWTALLRPISGATMWEVWERGGNYGAPIVALVLAGGFQLNYKDLFFKIDANPLNPARLKTAEQLLRFFLFLLLLGHAGFGFVVQKDMLAAHYASVGLPATKDFVALVGYFELFLSALVLIKPKFIWKEILYFVLFWKLLTEMLYVTSGPLVNIFEWIERWGDYGIPMALLFINKFNHMEDEND